MAPLTTVRSGSRWARVACLLGAASVVASCSLEETGTCLGGNCKSGTTPPRDAGHDAVSRVDSGDAGGDGAGDENPRPPDGGLSRCEMLGDPESDPSLVSDKLGVFVSLGGAAGNTGLESNPLQSINAGITQAVAQHKCFVYVCEATYSESVTLSASGILLLGGFDCADGWKGGGKPSAVMSNNTAGALIVGKSDTVTVENFEFDAESPSSFGDSSIAVSVVDSTAIVFRDVTMNAMPAFAGAAGAAGNNYADPQAPPGLNATAGSPPAPGGSETCSCIDKSTTVGGEGGASGGAGMPGQSGSAGAGGAEEKGGMGGSGSTETTSAAGATTPGVVMGVDFTTTTGAAGATPPPGQGGGGGGGSDGFCGGGGGCGGCGGGGGGGGQSGGSSIALLAIGSTVGLQSCALTAGAGGAGGLGGIGQAGQMGGNGGNFSGGNNAAGGGGGGGGAAGGSGGGGAGGYSAAVASHESTVLPNGSTLKVGMGGAPGAGGNANPASQAPGGGPGNAGSGGPASPGTPGSTGQPGMPGQPGQGMTIWVL